MKKKTDLKKIANLTLKGVALAMGIAVIVLGKLGTIDLHSSMTMIAVGLTTLTISLFED